MPRTCRAGSLLKGLRLRSQHFSSYPCRWRRSVPRKCPGTTISLRIGPGLSGPARCCEIRRSRNPPIKAASSVTVHHSGASTHHQDQAMIPASFRVMSATCTAVPSGPGICSFRDGLCPLVTLGGYPASAAGTRMRRVESDPSGHWDRSNLNWLVSGAGVGEVGGARAGGGGWA